MSDVIPTLGNRRPRIQAWLGRRLMRGGRRGREGGAGMLTDASLHHWERRLLLGHWARAAEGAGSRGKGRLWRLKSRRLAGERCQCGVGAARGRQEASKFESRLRQPQQGAASLGCCSLLKGEGRSEWFVVFLSVPIFLRVRRPRLSLWGASPQGQSLLRVCTDFGPRPPALTPPCPSSTHAPSRASWSRWPSRSPTWSSCMRRGRWTARLFRTSPPLCRPCRPLSATWCGWVAAAGPPPRLRRAGRTSAAPANFVAPQARWAPRNGLTTRGAARRAGNGWSPEAFWTSAAPL